MGIPACRNPRLVPLGKPRRVRQAMRLQPWRSALDFAMAGYAELPTCHGGILVFT